MSKIDIPIKTWNRIVEDYRNGMSPLMLSRKYGYGHELLRAKIRRSAFYCPRGSKYYQSQSPFRKKYHKLRGLQLPEEKWKKIISEHKKGVSSTKLSAKYNLNFNQLVHKIRNSPDYTPKFRPERIFLTKKEWDSIIEDHLKGMSPLKISRKYGYDYETIRSRLRGTKFYTPRSNRLYENPGVKEDIFEKIDSNKKAYWLGVLAADGNVYVNERSWKYIIQLYVDNKDVDWAKEFYNFIGNNKPVRFRTRQGTNFTKKTVTQVICAVSSKKMANSLISHGIIPKKSLYLRWPKLKNEKLYWNFIRGYWDGDGTVGKNYISVVGNEPYLKEMECFIRENVKFSVKQRLYKRWEYTFCLRYNTTRAAIIAAKIYDNTTRFPVLKRKWERAKILVNRYPIKKSKIKIL